MDMNFIEMFVNKAKSEKLTISPEIKDDIFI